MDIFYINYPWTAQEPSTNEMVMFLASDNKAFHAPIGRKTF